MLLEVVVDDVAVGGVNEGLEAFPLELEFELEVDINELLVVLLGGVGVNLDKDEDRNTGSEDIEEAGDISV